MAMLLVHLGSVVILAVAVEAFCRMGKYRPALCHALWLVVLVKLVVPPMVSWPISTDLLVSEAASGSPALSGATEIDYMEVNSGLTSGGSVAELEKGSRATSAVVEPVGRLALSAYFLFAWAAGGLWVGTRTILHFHRARRVLATGSPLPDWLHGQLTEICGRLGMGVPRATCVAAPVGVHVQITGPPVLVISAGALENVAAERWPAVLTHELAHLKRRDHWVAWLLLLAGAVWWWNPIYWWVRRRIRVFSELACDAWVVHAHPEGRRVYAETMVQFMTMFSRQQASAPAIGLAAWSGADQKRRLEMIMQGNGKCTLRLSHALLLALVALAVAPAWIASAADGAIPVPDFVAIEDAAWVLPLAPTDRILADLKKPVSLKFDDAHVGDVLAYIRDTFDVNIVLDQRVVAPPPGESTDTPESADDRSPIVTDGMIPVIIVKNVALEKSLETICRSRGLIAQARANHIWVSSPEQLRRDREAPVPHAVPGDTDSTLQELERVADFEDNDILFRDLVARIASDFEFNVAIDKRAALQLAEGEEPPKVFPPGLDVGALMEDWAIRELKLKQVSIGEWLYVATRMVGLSYSVQEGFVFISSESIVSQDGFRKAVE